MKEGSPDAYWLRVPATPQTVLSSEPQSDCRICLRTFYQSESSIQSQRIWSQPFWLTKTASKRISVNIEGSHKNLYLYVYRLHNTHYLEIFDRIPSLLLSPLQSRALQLKHYNRHEYSNHAYSTVTDTDTASDGTLSSISLESSSVDVSLYTTTSSSSLRSTGQPHSHHFFNIQSLTGSIPQPSIFLFESAYCNSANLQLVVDIPSVSFSLFDVVSGCYREVIHSVVKGIRCILQQGGCEMFSSS